MTLEEIDRKLEMWDNELQTIAANIHDMEASTGYQLLKNHHMTGISARRADQAVAVVEQLWIDWGLINTVMQQVVANRANLPQMFGRTQAISEIEALLMGHSIRLSPEYIPPEQRHISTSATRERTISPDQLKREMNANFRKLNTILQAFKDAWDTLERILTASTKKAKAIEAQALKYIAVLPVEITVLSQRLELMQQHGGRDPLLAVKSIGSDLKPDFTAALRAARQLERQQETLTADLALALQALEHLNTLRVEALKLQKEAEQVGCLADAIPSNKDLQTALSGIQQAFERADYIFVTSGLGQWWSDSEERKRQLETRVESIQQVVRERQLRQQELAVRLRKAYKSLEELRNLRVKVSRFLRPDESRRHRASFPTRQDRLSQTTRAVLSIV